MSGDGLWGAVSLLLHGDGVDGSTAVVDSSFIRKAPVVKGAAAISTVQSKFGGASLRLNGSGSYLAIPHAASLSMVSADFTAEAWVFLSAAVTDNRPILNKSGRSGVSNPNWGLYVLASGKLALGVGTSGAPGTWLGTITGTSVLPTGAWVHVAGVKAGTTYLVAVNGVIEASSTIAGVPADARAADLLVGWEDGQPASQCWNGYIDEVRITAGFARYAANFTPPSAPFENAPDWWGTVRHGEHASARAVATPRRYTGARPVPRSRTRADNTAGPGTILGTVKVDTLPIARKVRLFDVASGRLLKETWSDKTGVYRFDGLALDRPYTVLSHDHQRDYNATVADYVYAEVLP